MKMSFPLIFALVLLVVGTLLTVAGVLNLSGQKAATKWPSVEGVILESKVVTEERQMEKLKKVDAYRAAISYRYSINGKDYLSKQVQHDPETKTYSAFADNLVKTFPVGKKVPVFYNPDNPSEAVLLAGSGFQSYVMIGLGIAMDTAGAFLIFFLLRAKG
jgi:hypothetical protein